MEHQDDCRWRKSSYSGNGGANWVEVGARADADRVLVRDTKDRGAPVLRFTPVAWRRFAARLQSEGVSP